MTTVRIENGSFFATPEAIAIFGENPIRKCRKNESVTRQACVEPTTCKTYGGDTVAMPDTHYLAFVVGGDGKPRPVAKDVWDNQYMLSENNDGTWVPTSRQIVPIPQGVTCELVTIEADKNDPAKRAIQTVSYPDYVAIGNSAEVYSNGLEFVQKTLIPLDGRGPLF